MSFILVGLHCTQTHLVLVLDTPVCPSLCTSHSEYCTILHEHQTRAGFPILRIRIHQRRRRYFKSGRATANKRSLVHVGGGLQQAMCGSKCYLRIQNTWVPMQSGLVWTPDASGRARKGLGNNLARSVLSAGMLPSVLT